MTRSTRAAATGVPEDLTIRRRNLPHWEAGGSTYFVTFRLKRTPRSVVPSQGDPKRPAIRPLCPSERRIVVASLLHWHPRKWQIHLLTVMPDHVHVLATPQERATQKWFSLSEILHGVKGHSARVINQGRGRRGPVWDAESFDRIVRDPKEFDEKAKYIVNNAVKRGLVADPWDYDGLWWQGMEEEPKADR